MKRNLIYYIYYPGHITEYHRINIALLRRYWSVFDGEKILVITRDREPGEGELTSLSFADSIMRPDIEEILNVHDLPGANIIHGFNDPDEWEAAHFVSSLEYMSEYRFADGLTFYAHCKGVSRPVSPGLTTWIEYLYKENLENPPSLENHLFSGICGKLLACMPYVPEDFHYSGSFYWFRHQEVMKKVTKMYYDKGFPCGKYLTERFPAIIAKQHECEFRFYSTARNESFYEQYTWDRILQNK